jgi:hypothetical protein
MYDAHHESRNSMFFYDLIVSRWSTVLHAHHCDGIFWTSRFGYGYHVPHSSNNTKGATITLLREPSDRLISAFLFNDGMMLPRGSPWRQASQAVKSIINSTACPISTYASLPGVEGCQTKMILGRHCGEVYSLTRRDIETAIDMMSFTENFAFIGLSEEAEASAMLFLAMYGPCYARKGARGVCEESLQQLQDHKTALNKTYMYSRRYRSNKRHSTDMHDKLAMQLHRVGWRDAADEEIYKAARRIFYKRCEEYSIPTITIANLTS